MSVSHLLENMFNRYVFTLTVFCWTGLISEFLHLTHATPLLDIQLKFKKKKTIVGNAFIWKIRNFIPRFPQIGERRLEKSIAFQSCMTSLVPGRILPILIYCKRKLTEL